MQVVLISTYELGRQPFGLASPAAWLRARGHKVVCADLAMDPIPVEAVRAAGLVAFYLPMHTATRLALPLIGRVREINPAARLCAYGLYAPLNEQLLRGLGMEAILGGEFESGLAALADAEPPGPVVSLQRQLFRTPDRDGLPALQRYARLQVGDSERVTGSTEASRGCKHYCRHCPVVPVYNGTFRIVQRDVVLEDIRGQVAAGAQHITFGDPDFFNGPSHAIRIVEALHREFADVTYDVTIKVEHLLKHRDLLPVLRGTGCSFITSAVESLDDQVLLKLDKGHTHRDFLRCVDEVRSAGLVMNPTFIAFTPWTTRASYRDLLATLRELELVDSTASIQLALRLLITSGSRLLELDDIRAVTLPFDAGKLVYPWRHPDQEVDALASQVSKIVADGLDRRLTFARLWQLVCEETLPVDFAVMPRATVPYLNEPWYC